MIGWWIVREATLRELVAATVSAATELVAEVRAAVQEPPASTM